jgi:hypothetical protein
MISKSRMTTDLTAQSILLTAVVILLLAGAYSPWALIAFTVLALWQVGSALHLALGHAYRERFFYLKVFALLLIALPLKLWLAGAWAFFLLGVLVSAYFWATFRDTIIVLERPRSFWDI